MSELKKGRIQGLDWLRGFVMVLMTIDHSGTIFDAHHLHGDSARSWIPGSPLPAGEFLTRWITHLCAPTFVLLSGASLALSSEKRCDSPGQTAFIVRRGLLIAALDPLWMSLGFTLYHPILLQVLYAIGISLVCMAFLRRLSSRVLLGLAVAIQLLGELSLQVDPSLLPWILGLLLRGGRLSENLICGYPLLPWLSMMMTGWVLGRWLLETERDPRQPLMVGMALLGLFIVIRGYNGYGNWGLYRESQELLQWLHVAKYPPCLAYTTLELGLAFVLLAFFLLLEKKGFRHGTALSTLGSTAFFYYLLHVHLMGLAALGLQPDPEAHGLAKTYGVAALTVVGLYPFCRRYQSYRKAHPDGWARYF